MFSLRRVIEDTNLRLGQGNSVDFVSPTLHFSNARRAREKERRDFQRFLWQPSTARSREVKRISFTLQLLFSSRGREISAFSLPNWAAKSEELD
jgi:hypothetical protein